jgi:hypothetical protein
MAEYQQLLDPMTGGIATTILRRADNAHIPDDPANRDRQDYETWLAYGGVPDPPDPPPQPAAPTPLKLPAAAPVDPLDATPKAFVDAELTPIIQRIEALEARIYAVERRV